MKKIWPPFALMLFVLIGISADARARPIPTPMQGSSSCLGADDHSNSEINRLKALSARTDNHIVAAWTGMGFLPVSQTEIMLVTDSITCASVLSAYNTAADLVPPDDPPLDSLYVIRVGPRYDAFSPAVRVGEFLVHRIFDTTFVHIDTHVR